MVQWVNAFIKMYTFLTLAVLKKKRHITSNIKSFLENDHLNMRVLINVV